MLWALILRLSDETVATHSRLHRDSFRAPITCLLLTQLDCIYLRLAAWNEDAILKLKKLSNSEFIWPFHDSAIRGVGDNPLPGCHICGSIPELSYITIV